MEQKTNAEKLAIARTAQLCVEAKFGVAHSTLIKDFRLTLAARADGPVEAEAFELAMTRKSEFEHALKEAEQDEVALAAQVKLDLEKAIKRAETMERNARRNEFVTTYRPPAAVRRLTIAAQAVYMVIAKYCRDGGHKPLTNAQIQAEAGVSLATCKRSTSLLSDLGVIQKLERYDKEARTNLPNLYRLAKRELVVAARISFKNLGGLTSDPQKGTEFISVPTRGAQQETEVPIEDTGDSRFTDGNEGSELFGDEPEEAAAMEQLAKQGLAELGENISTHAGPGAVTQMVERIRREKFTKFDDADWQRFRHRLGRKADLALIETALLTEVRAGNVYADKEDAWKKPIRSPSGYLHGILRKSKGNCRPEVTLGRLLMARKRHVPSPVLGAIFEHEARRMRARRIMANS